MKTNSPWLLKAIKGILTFVWYANIVLALIAFIFLTFKFATSDYAEFSSPVKYTSHNEAIKMTPLTPDTQNIVVTNDQGILKMEMKNTVWNMTTAYFFFFALEALAFIIILQLRKFFNTLMSDTPFQYDNIRRLKIIALCFALLTPLHILLGIDTAYILHHQVKDFHLMNMVWTESFIGLILGAVIYVMADVFNYGFNLQKENEEFV